MKKREIIKDSLIEDEFFDEGINFIYLTKNGEKHKGEAAVIGGDRYYISNNRGSVIFRYGSFEDCKNFLLNTKEVMYQLDKYNEEK